MVGFIKEKIGEVFELAPLDIHLLQSSQFLEGICYLVNFLSYFPTGYFDSSQFLQESYSMMFQFSLLADILAQILHLE